MITGLVVVPDDSDVAAAATDPADDPWGSSVGGISCDVAVVLSLVEVALGIFIEDFLLALGGLGGIGDEGGVFGCGIDLASFPGVGKVVRLGSSPHVVKKLSSS